VRFAARAASSAAYFSRSALVLRVMLPRGAAARGAVGLGVERVLGGFDVGGEDMVRVWGRSEAGSSGKKP
jgi:hypothetical protein